MAREVFFFFFFPSFILGTPLYFPFLLSAFLSPFFSSFLTPQVHYLAILPPSFSAWLGVGCPDFRIAGEWIGRRGYEGRKKTTRRRERAKKRTLGETSGIGIGLSMEYGIWDMEQGGSSRGGARYEAGGQMKLSSAVHLAGRFFFFWSLLLCLLVPCGGRVFVIFFFSLSVWHTRDGRRDTGSLSTHGPGLGQ
ncbi:hypothetical protein B0T24DRAFT_266721 [Lasiosphaeria ovina]|uniref:Uncharacterized protein n=1 Tax=Lasiosphaeria ovina TaxID=92902 RepID=A0AAE0KCL6_9PEZI|nr:hypothetical protein B0T24DRAFT_266721 [Lasiosphaeria ovina]